MPMITAILMNVAITTTAINDFGIEQRQQFLTKSNRTMFGIEKKNTYRDQEVVGDVMKSSVVSLTVLVSQTSEIEFDFSSVSIIGRCSITEHSLNIILSCKGAISI
jgi:hypothetical protein